jgi:GNAT superfamily N-acetyltransferase
VTARTDACTGSAAWPSAARRADVPERAAIQSDNCFDIFPPGFGPIRALACLARRTFMTTIRAARTYDAPAIADLCGELGYPATRQQIVRRLAAIEALPASGVLVAEDDEGRVAGWLQVVLGAQLCDDACAEITGLVVRATARGRRIGSELVRAAEDWACARGARRLRVRSRIERERAHRFYERAGYARIKTQMVFGKPLA